ncbi:MAG: hypothetical protein QXS81_01255 [Candidatus Micrarchaeaceae archaeon]
MELEEMTESEYKKYKKMDKIAHRPQWNAIAIGSVLGIISFAVFAFLGMVAFITTSKPMNLLIKYTNATIQSAHLNFTNNASITASITKLTQSPTLVATYLVHNFALIDLIETIVFAIILIFFGYFAFKYFMNIFPIKYPVSTYKGLKRALREKDAIFKRLIERGYTQKEIEWYFEVREKIQELANMVN